MSRRGIALFVAMAGLAVFVPETSDISIEARPLGSQDEVTIMMSNPGVHPRLAVQSFIAPANDAELVAATTTMADVLWADLDFEREFYMIPRATSGAIPVAPADQLPYQRWTELGADVVIVATARRNRNDIAVQLRAISVRGDSQGRQIFGMEYGNCRMDSPRRCAHAIADDMHKQIRGLDGVALTRIAFTSTRDAGRVAGRPEQTTGLAKEIYIADYDGENERRFTVNRNLNITPAWSPVGGLLAYVSYVSGAQDVYVANLAEPGRRLLRPAGGTVSVQNWLPAWSPDGNRLAFVSNRSGNSDIWVVNRDGSGLENLTNNPTIDNAPTWSPDGSKIAFTSDRLGPGQLWVMSSNGTGVQRIIADRIDRPTWSPLNFIAFTIGGGPGYDIGLYDFGNPGVKVLTDGLGSNESPAVAPNGRHIVFVTSRWGNAHLAVIDRTGQNLKRLTEVGVNTYPSWEPIQKR